MEFKIESGDPTIHETPCLILGVFENGELSGPAAAVDRSGDGYLSDFLRTGDMDGKIGHTLILYRVPGSGGERVLLAGCGKREEFHRRNYGKALAAAVKRLDDTHITEALCTLPELGPIGMTPYQAVRDAVTICADTLYRYDQTKQKKKKPRPTLKRFPIWVAQEEDPKTAQRAIRHGTAIVQGITLAKDLSNLPANLCTPTYLADRAKDLGRDYPQLRVEILEEKDMEALGMGSLLSVSRGSRQPAKLILMEYRGGPTDAKPVVLVGKGLTFDAGGISIKPSSDMDEMKFDMCGGASVFGTLRCALELELPLNLIGVVPASENLPGGDAYKPGDIVTSLSGRTIEILNTDAEGRLILCDALTYCERFEPDVVIDIATLTGACVVALGKYPCGLFTQNEPLAAELLAAGEAAGDRAWRMPLWDDYQDELDSNFADMANIGNSRWGGAITAACFLARYTKKYPWAHLDIAGIAWHSGKKKGATGRPVALLTELLLERSGQLK